MTCPKREKKSQSSTILLAMKQETDGEERGREKLGEKRGRLKLIGSELGNLESSRATECICLYGPFCRQSSMFCIAQGWEIHTGRSFIPKSIHYLDWLFYSDHKLPPNQITRDPLVAHPWLSPTCWGGVGLWVQPWVGQTLSCGLLFCFVVFWFSLDTKAFLMKKFLEWK